jgi:hypothetical protein
MFDTVLPVRRLGEAAREVADRLFFETVVRVHRAGEGAPLYRVEAGRAVRGTGDPAGRAGRRRRLPTPLADFLTGVLHEELKRRLEQVNMLAAGKDRSVPDGRRYVEAMLGFEVYCHHLFQALHA